MTNMMHTIPMCFPQVSSIDLVNYKTDIKARSEKYKQELAFKLSKIRNELNTKDSKIDSLISRIGTGS